MGQKPRYSQVFRQRAEGRTCALVAAAVLASLVGPVAGAQEGPFPSSLTLLPESDSATSGTCNEFTASLAVEGPAQGFTVDVVQTLQGAATEPDEMRELAFCDPPNPSGPNPTGQGAAFGGVVGNNPGATAGQPGRNTTVRAEVGPTDVDGEVTFGVSMVPATASADVTVTVWFDREDDDVVGEGDPFDSSTKTWIAQDPPPLQVDAAPEAAAVQAGTTHGVTVTVTNGGNPVQGIVPSTRIVADGPGRPAGDVDDPGAGASPNFSPGNAPSGYTCTATDAQGVSTCTYQDPPGSGPGTDTVVFFVDTSGDPDLPDGADPQDAVQVTWVAPPPGGPQQPGNPQARNIRLCQGDSPAGLCDTTSRVRTVGDEHEVAALVTNRHGNPLFGVPVQFRESGPGGLLPGDVSSIVRSTGLDGIARATLRSALPGTSSIVAEISPPGTPGGFRGPGVADDECEQSAGPDGAPAGNCVSQALIVRWQPLPVCADGADNDGDGLTDGEDPVCRDGGALSELPVHHTRAISMRFDDLVVRDVDVLLVSGRLKLVDADDAFLDCVTRHLLKVKRLVNGEWETVGKSTTDGRGRYRVPVPDRPGEYRAIARRTEVPIPGAPAHVCRRAEKEKPHIHA